MDRLSRRFAGGRWMKAFALAAMVLPALLSGLPANAQNPTVVTIWDQHVHDKKYKKDAFKAFSAANPDVRIEYTSQVAGTYQTILDAAIRSGTPPDLFAPIGVDIPKAIASGWVQPLDDIAPSKEELRKFMALFPEDQQPFVENVNVYGGKVYSWPTSIQDMAMMLFWNPDLFAQAGLKGSGGGAAEPDQLDVVRLAARKITEMGQGKIFGIVHGIKGGIWDQDVTFPATGDGYSLNGWPYHGFDYRTGRFDFKGPGLKAHFQNWLDMKQDGSILPGDMSMDDEQAKFKFSQGLAGMIYGGYWVPGGLLAVNPDAKFDTILAPTVKRNVRLGGIPGGGGLAGNSEYYVSSKVKNKAAVWKVIQFLVSEQYLVGWVKAGGGYSPIPAYNKPEYFPHPTIGKIVQASTIGRRLAPVVSTEAAAVWARMEPGQPLIHETLTGMWVGRLGWDALDDYERRLNASFTKALADAQKEGKKVTLSDFIFPDWDPAKNYLMKAKKP